MGAAQQGQNEAGVRYQRYAISSAAKIYRLEGFVQVKVDHPKFETVEQAHCWAQKNLDLGARLR